MAARSPSGGWLRLTAVAATVIALDQATKQIAIAAVDRGESVGVFPGLAITNTRNTGVAFGALQGSGDVVGVLIAIALAVLLAYFGLNASRAWLWLPAGLLLGGALGNLADRVREGAVIDFLDPVAWPAFNLADACIVAGVLALLYVAEARPGET
ncbi:MAG: signal peptidase II [Thermoleophilaceae bacterium]